MTQKPFPTNLISAKITDEAYEIYYQHKLARNGGAMISKAIVALEGEKEVSKQQNKLIRELQAELAELRVELADWMKNWASVNHDRLEAHKLLRQKLSPTIYDYSDES